MRRPRLWLAALGALSAFAASGAITAVALPSSFEAELDARLASDDINGLLALVGRITTPEDEKQATGLMASRASVGKGFDGLPFLLAKAYRETGDAKSATFWLSYGRAVLLADAQKCIDKTAIDQKYQNTLNTFRDLDRGLASWPPSERSEMLDRVIALEEDTFDRRQADKWLCTGGVLDVARREIDAGRAPKDPRYYQLYTDRSSWRRLNSEEITVLRKKLEVTAETNSKAR